MARSMDETVVYSKEAKWYEYVTQWEFEPNQWHPGRVVGDVWQDYRHRIETKNGKTYPEYCHGFNVDEGKHYPDREERCECCRLKIGGQMRYYMNWISREAEEQKPAKPKQHWSPIYMIDMSPTLFKRIKELKMPNKGISVDDAIHGAIIQIKYDPQAEAASMYSATMDEKDTPVTDEQKEYIVVQKYPDGQQKVVRGDGTMPGLFEYIRCISSREDMIRSLKNNGYYDKDSPPEEEAEERPKKSKPTTKTPVAKVSQIDAETPIEDDDDDSLGSAVNQAPEVMDDEDPLPRNVKPAAKAKQVSDEPCAECPTEFGSFANSIDCYTKCAHLWERCKAASESKDKPVAKASKKVQIDEDDDTV